MLYLYSKTGATSSALRKSGSTGCFKANLKLLSKHENGFSTVSKSNLVSSTALITVAFSS